jgi:hypothetical protein
MLPLSAHDSIQTRGYHTCDDRGLILHVEEFTALSAESSIMAKTRLPAKWQRAGFATGAVQCELSLPASDACIDRRCQRTRHAFEEARQFIRRHLPSAPLALEGATFTITADFRARGGGIRRRVICRWRAGESVTAVLEEGARIWAQIPKERQE